MRWATDAGGGSGSIRHLPRCWGRYRRRVVGDCIVGRPARPIRSQWLSQEIARRQLLYSEFLDAAVCATRDALEHDQIDTKAVSKLYGEMGRMRLKSSEPVLREAYKLVRKILGGLQDRTEAGRKSASSFARRDRPLHGFFGCVRAELMCSSHCASAGNSPLNFRPPRWSPRRTCRLVKAGAEPDARHPRLAAQGPSAPVCSHAAGEERDR